MAPKPRSGEVGAAALVRGLHDALTAAQGARVVVVAPSAQSPVVFDDIHFTSRPYDAYCAYAQSKAATILFTVAIAKRWAVDAITANALNPGGVVTNIQRHLAQATLRSIGALDEHNRPLAVPRGWKTPQQGAATSVLLAASPLVEGVDWSLLRGLQRSRRPHRAGRRHARSRPHALDQNDADRLWDETTRLLHH